MPQMPTLGEHLIQTVDAIPFSEINSGLILSAFRAAGFQAIDQGHHLSIQIQAIPDQWECACLYLEDPQTLYVKAMARRWWLLWTGGDQQQQFERFWAVVEELEAKLDYLKFVQGTVAELKHPNL